MHGALPLLTATLSLSVTSSALHIATKYLRRAGPPAAALTPDWRAVRAGLIESERDTGPSPLTDGDDEMPPPPPPSLIDADAWWVHELVRVERGCVLLAQPGAIFPEQPLMHRAAVLVLEHSEDRGTVGLLLERPTNRSIASLLERKKDPALFPFQSRPLMIGGNVLQPRRGIRVLTRRCDVAGSAEVVFGLYECTTATASRLVTVGAAKASDFCFFAAACQWQPHELQKEVEAAAWVPVAASASALFPSAAASAAARASGVAHTGGPTKDALYFALMEGVGGEYARLARATRSDTEVDEWLQACATRATSVWADLATRVVRARQHNFAAAGPRGTTPPGSVQPADGERFSGIRRSSSTNAFGSGGHPNEASVDEPLSIEAAALMVHTALYPRDNLTDIWDGLDALAEQARMPCSHALHTSLGHVAPHPRAVRAWSHRPMTHALYTQRNSPPTPPTSTPPPRPPAPPIPPTNRPTRTPYPPGKLYLVHTRNRRHSDGRQPGAAAQEPNGHGHDPTPRRQCPRRRARNAPGRRQGRRRQGPQRQGRRRRTERCAA